MTALSRAVGNIGADIVAKAAKIVKASGTRVD